MTSKTERIDDIELTDAVELYLDDRRAELAKATLYSHKSRLTRFTEWCSTEDIQYISDIEPTDCLRFKTDRREHPDVESTSTLKTQLDTLRVFLRWCEKINVAKPGVADAVISPTLSGN